MRAGATSRCARLIERCLLTIFVSVLVAEGARAGPASLDGPGDGSSVDSIGLRLLEAPDTRDPRARLYIVDHVSPGSTISRRILISNMSTSAAHINLYPSAARISDGSFVGAAGDSPNELSTWTTIMPRSVDIPAGGTAEATVTIVLPSDAAPGERYAAVWAETRSEKDTEGVVQISRVGIRIYLSVGSGGAPAADFTIDSLTAVRSSNGQPLVRAVIHNTGGRALDMNGVLRLVDGPSELSAGPFPAMLGTTLAIGATDSVTILLDDQVPAGPWDARLTMKSGLLERSAHAIITFPITGTALPVDTSSGGAGWLQLILGGIAFVIAAGIAALIVRRKTSLRERRLGFVYEGKTG